MTRPGNISVAFFFPRHQPETPGLEIELMSTYTFTSESVSEGHPDKVADFIADSILDAHLALDPKSRVACEVLVKSGDVILAGEITSNGDVDYEKIARQAIREIGYTDKAEAFNADG